MPNDNVLSVEDDAEHVENTGPNIRNYNKVDGAQSIRVGAKDIRCIFCDTFWTGGRAVLAQKNANVECCVRIRKSDDNRYVEFKIAQKADCSVASKQTNLFWIQ